METWNTVKTLKDIAAAYQNIYEKKEVDPSRDKDGDGDNDFADNMVARMVASGMSREEAIKKVKNKEYNKEEYSLDEETKAEKEARIAARRARVKQMEDEGAVMTSSRRASEVAKQRKEAKKAEALERAGSSVLNQMRGASGRVSERPMGSEAPKAKEKAPEATRRLNPNLRKDNLGSAADRVLRAMRKEEVEAYETYEFVASYLLENNFASTVDDANVIINNMSEGWFAQIIEGAYDVYLNRMGVKSKLSDMATDMLKSPEEKEKEEKERKKRNKTHSVGGDLMQKYRDAMNKNN